ncbi:PIN domain-containing protein [Haladaptatus sp. DYF46]|uniref:PIN domain-containing protein n=1 Tax=Haladaptatus sp. DYF46 TaxID=2886041 RepID=UPI001E4F5903|nr:PIN domain-containing protein [Haladaptatus sp. DYF46]
MIPDCVVFDAEPLIAHADDEPGSKTVEQYLNAVAAENTAGYTSRVNLTEVRYTLAQKYDRATADEYLEWLDDLGFKPVDVEQVWMDASDYILEYNPALGDSFARATATHLDATLLVGGDNDYDETSSEPIERFRDGSA